MPITPVTAADLVSPGRRGAVKLSIWLREGLMLRHFQYPCHYDSPTWRSPVGQVGRAGHSSCPGCDLPGQLDGLLRTSLPGKTVSGQDPASLDQLNLLQRRQRQFVIIVHEARGQMRPGFACDKAHRCQRVSHNQGSTIFQAQGRVSGGVAGRVDHARTARHVEPLFVCETRRLSNGHRPGHSIAQHVQDQMQHLRLPQREPGRLSPALARSRRKVIVVHEHPRARLRAEPFRITHVVRVVMGQHHRLTADSGALREARNPVICRQ